LRARLRKTFADPELDKGPGQRKTFADPELDKGPGQRFKDYWEQPSPLLFPFNFYEPMRKEGMNSILGYYSLLAYSSQFTSVQSEFRIESMSKSVETKPKLSFSMDSILK
jgi:hypothetical protein